MSSQVVYEGGGVARGRPQAFRGSLTGLLRVRVLWRLGAILMVLVAETPVRVVQAPPLLLGRPIRQNA